MDVVSCSRSEFQENCILLHKEQWGDGVFRLTMLAPKIAAAAFPGQFVMVACTTQTRDPLLRRPFSIHRVLTDGRIQLLFQVVGQGTKLLSQFVVGATLDVLGPLGRGFQFPKPDANVGLIGGGMGIAPLLFGAERLRQCSFSPVVLLGARNAAAFGPLVDDFSALGCTPQLSTDDGGLGRKGRVGDLFSALDTRLNMVYTCGPLAMMAEIVRLCMAAGIGCQVSLETHMACGLGACLGCAIPAVNGAYLHVCKHGPVFPASQLIWP